MASVQSFPARAPEDPFGSFTGPNGDRHSVEVVAETLYEAAACGPRLLRSTEWADVVGADQAGGSGQGTGYDAHGDRAADSAVVRWGGGEHGGGVEKAEGEGTAELGQGEPSVSSPTGLVICSSYLYCSFLLATRQIRLVLAFIRRTSASLTLSAIALASSSSPRLFGATALLLSLSRATTMLTARSAA